jgi:hypothetical protein
VLGEASHVLEVLAGELVTLMSQALHFRADASHLLAIDDAERLHATPRDDMGRVPQRHGFGTVRVTEDVRVDLASVWVHVDERAR